MLNENVSQSVVVSSLDRALPITTYYHGRYVEIQQFLFAAILPQNKEQKYVITDHYWPLRSAANILDRPPTRAHLFTGIWH